jgi:hypothetical protein
VDDADERSSLAVSDRQITANALDERVALAKRGGERQDSWRLVDHDHVPVFVKHVESAGDSAGLRSIRKELDCGARLDLQAGFVATVSSNLDTAIPNSVLGRSA